MFFASCQPVPVQEKDELHIAVAANMQFAMDSIAKVFEEKSGIATSISTNSTGMLTAQIKQGAPYDLLIAANMYYPEKLIQDGLASSASIYAYGRIVLVFNKSKHFESLNNALLGNRTKRIAIASPEVAPYGTAAVEFLNNTNLLPSIKKKLIYGESIGQVNQYLVSNATDVAFTSYSFLCNYKQQFNYLAIDSNSYSPIEQGAVILKGSKEKEAKLFLEFLFSEQCKEILHYFGYTTN